MISTASIGHLFLDSESCLVSRCSWLSFPVQRTSCTMNFAYLMLIDLNVSIIYTEQSKTFPLAITITVRIRTRLNYFHIENRSRDLYYRCPFSLFLTLLLAFYHFSTETVHLFLSALLVCQTPPHVRHEKPTPYRNPKWC